MIRLQCHLVCLEKKIKAVPLYTLRELMNTQEVTRLTTPSPRLLRTEQFLKKEKHFGGVVQGTPGM